MLSSRNHLLMKILFIKFKNCSTNEVTAEAGKKPDKSIFYKEKPFVDIAEQDLSGTQGQAVTEKCIIITLVVSEKNITPATS